jgi:cold shock protein
MNAAGGLRFAARALASKFGFNPPEFFRFCPRGASASLDFSRPWAMQSAQLGRTQMARGTVKWFNPTKGYGFIEPQGGGKDVFVHISAVEKAGLSGLNEGQTVEYEEISNKGKSSAENLKVQR